MLRRLSLLEVYDSSEYDLVHDLIVPLLSSSNNYLRGVGYFTSGWLRVAAPGVAQLIENGGRAKVIVSPNLEAADWEALKLGAEAQADDVLRNILRRDLARMAETLEQETVNALAWMVADELLEFRFAVPRNTSSDGDYHDKVAVFEDSNGDSVAIHGSFNDSVKGTLNGEAFSVFRSWEPGQNIYVAYHTKRLTSLWENRNRQFSAYRIPDAVKADFVRLRSSVHRPYSSPLLGTRTDDVVKAESPQIKLHSYQEEAISAWIRSGCRGVFEMATGTGKTYTSLAAAANRYRHMGRLSLLIFVPYLHLLEQWKSSCEKFGFSPILCSGEHGQWATEVKTSVQDFNLGAVKHLSVVAVHKTAASDRFQKAISKLKPATTLMIADEAHGLGARHLRNALMGNAGLRLGLSATPRRWFDDEGTNTIFEYFGRVCYEYSLEEAIGTYLTPYEYHPKIIHLTEDELDEYSELTSRIVTLASHSERDDETSDALKKLLLKRARIISSAQQKLPCLLRVLSDYIHLEQAQGREAKGILVYCAPGKHREVLRAVADLGLRCHEFVHTVTLREREDLLHQFASGHIQALVAVKCLDEGVDVPATRAAFFLASSTNPREFVQRRGRILRLSEGKSRAMVYDFVVVPTDYMASTKDELGASLLRREMPRFAEFSSLAQNEFEARSVVRNTLYKYEMLNLLQEKPWDIYKSGSIRERDEIE